MRKIKEKALKESRNGKAHTFLSYINLYFFSTNPNRDYITGEWFKIKKKFTAFPNYPTFQFFFYGLYEKWDKAKVHTPGLQNERINQDLFQTHHVEGFCKSIFIDIVQRVLE